MAIGKITSIVKSSNSGIKTMTNSLASHNKSRYPGTGSFYLPSISPSGRYRTGLDEDAPEIEKIVDTKERDAEKKRIKEKRKRLEKATGFDLSPTSKFWNYSLYTYQDQAHVQPIKLVDGDNLFDFSNPIDEINFSWLRQCDTIATSYEAYKRGEKGPEVRFYVHDDEVEGKRKYDRKKEINEAVIANDNLSPEKRKKVAYLMGLGVAENTSEDIVYNIVDDQLKETEFKEGKFKGLSPVRMFMNLVEMESKILNNKFLVEEAVRYNVYRVRAGGALYEGEIKIADNQEALVSTLCNEDHQEELIALNKKVKSKKLAVV